MSNSHAIMLENMRQVMQQYVDEMDSEQIFDGEKVSQKAHAAIFTDLLLYFNDGKELTQDQKVIA